jgi:hypothetical protein
VGVLKLPGGEGEGDGCARDGAVALAALLRQAARDARNDIWLCTALNCKVTASSLRVSWQLSASTLDSRPASDALSRFNWVFADSSSSK